MKKGKWYYEAQKLFSKWKVKENKQSDCAKQILTLSTLEEHHNIYPKGGGMPQAFTLHAYKNTGEVYLLPEYGEPVRIYLRKRTDL